MGIMLVYDITNEKSFDNIKNWIRNIEEHASADVEKMILGNKCDMNDRRQVGWKIVLIYRFISYNTMSKLQCCFMGNMVCGYLVFTILRNNYLRNLRIL